jgi:hypothetical protein
MKYHGYYSAHQDNKYGHIIYKDNEGNNVKVTEVIDALRKPVSKWNDLVFVGEVTDFVSSTVKIYDKPSQMSEAEYLKELYNRALEALANQNKCQKQFKVTNKCFCHTCPIKNIN